MHKLRISGLSRLAVVAALAAGVVLGLAAMPGCGSDCPTPEQRAYLNEAEEWADKTEASARDFARIAEEPGRRPEALIDDEWRRRLRSVLDEFDSAQEEMMALDPPPGTEEVHRALVRVAEVTIEANDLFWRGVLEVEAETLERSNARRRESTRLAEEVLRVTERFCE